MFGRKRSIFKGPTSSGSSNGASASASASSSSSSYANANGSGNANSNGALAPDPFASTPTPTPPSTSHSSDTNHTPDLLPSPLPRPPRHVSEGSTDSDQSPGHDPERVQALHHHRPSPSLRSIHELNSLTTSQARHRSVRRSLTPQPSATKPFLHIPGIGRRQKSADNVRPGTAEPTLFEDFDSTDDLSSGGPTRPPTARSFTEPQAAVTAAAAAAAAATAAPHENMASFPMGPPPTARGSAFQGNAGMYAGGGPGAGPSMMMAGGSMPTNPGAVYQHIHDMASKRISTLDYLRKAHEGRVYWFNTLLFNKIDLAKLPYFDPRRLARRATNYLLLGFSLPAVLDLNTQSPTDYLRAMSSLLADFESYQTAHPPEGTSGTSALARARIPQLFKRAAATGGKGRRSSSVTAEMAAFPAAGGDSTGAGGAVTFGNGATESAKAAATLGLAPSTGTGSSSLSTVGEGGGGGAGDLLPGEEYTHLLTPSIPFDPDYFETFATLCDVLIDCYSKIMSLCTPETCTAAVGDLFGKADARVRKIIVAGVVREFEDASRSGVKTEVAGVGKVVLGGLM